MHYIILVFGILLLAAGVVLMIRPATILDYLGRNKDSAGIHVLAVVVRLVLGGALIAYSDQSGFPLTFRVLGWIILIAAIALAVMGRSNFKKLMNWAMGLADKIGRVAGLAAILFGGFLVYATL